jgi:hypothetical protein
MCITAGLNGETEPALNKCTLRRDLYVLLPQFITPAAVRRAKKGCTIFFIVCVEMRLK